jgi:protein phosphatase
MELIVPDFGLLLLIGVSGAGKSTFARKHFNPNEILSSDFFRGMISDDESDQTASSDAFSALHFIADCRLARRRLTVIDATNVQPKARRSLLDLAKRQHSPVAAIVFNLPEQVARERNHARRDRQVETQVIAHQQNELERSLPRLKKEGIHPLYVLDSIEDVDSAVVIRQPPSFDRRVDQGPFDLIGDIHGCFEELCELLEKLGYGIQTKGHEHRLTAPPGRKLILLGDLVDRGPMSPQVLHLAMDMVSAGQGYVVPGNHDDKLMRYLLGRSVQVAYGLEDTLEQMEAEPPDFRSQVLNFLRAMPNYLWLDDGKLVAAHAGMLDALIGRDSNQVREFALYGQTSGDLDEFGLPKRMNWSREYRGKAKIVYGHTPVGDPHWVNNTLNIDTGCIYGGALSALRYPELELVSVPARYIYAHTRRDFLEGKPIPPAYPKTRDLDPNQE